MNDRPEVRKTFARFDIETVDCTYSISGGKGKAVKELIISGGEGMITTKDRL